MLKFVFSRFAYKDVIMSQDIFRLLKEFQVEFNKEAFAAIIKACLSHYRLNTKKFTYQQFLFVLVQVVKHVFPDEGLLGDLVMNLVTHMGEISRNIDVGCYTIYVKTQNNLSSTTPIANAKRLEVKEYSLVPSLPQSLYS